MTPGSSTCCSRRRCFPFTARTSLGCLAAWCASTPALISTRWPWGGAARSTASSSSPKPSVYLRTHHAAWQRNERARQAVETAAAGEVELARINAGTLQQLMPATAQAAAAGTVSPAVVAPMAATPTAAAPAATAAAGGARSEGGLLSFQPFGQHPSLQAATSPTANGHPSIVGGIWLGDVEALATEGPQKGPKRTTARNAQVHDVRCQAAHRRPGADVRRAMAQFPLALPAAACC